MEGLQRTIRLLKWNENFCSCNNYFSSLLQSWWRAKRKCDIFLKQKENFFLQYLDVKRHAAVVSLDFCWFTNCFYKFTKKRRKKDLQKSMPCMIINLVWTDLKHHRVFGNYLGVKIGSSINWISFENLSTIKACGTSRSCILVEKK